MEINWEARFENLSLSLGSRGPELNFFPFFYSDSRIENHNFAVGGDFEADFQYRNKGEGNIY